MDFLDNIKNSIYNPEFYRKLRSKPLPFSFKYFYILAFILAVIITAKFSFQEIPGINVFLTGLGPEIVNAYPSELAVTIKNGQASSNVAEPYFVRMPGNIQMEKYRNISKLDHLIVIDTKNQFSEESFLKYSSLVFLTKTSVAFRKDDGRIEIQPLSGMPDLIIDKASVSSFVGKIQPFTKFAAPLFVLAFFIGFMVSFSIKLAYLLLAALLILLVAKVKNIPLSYKQSYQAGLHIITLPLLLSAVSTLLNMQIVIPFFTTILIIIMAAINFESRKTKLTN